MLRLVLVMLSLAVTDVRKWQAASGAGSSAGLADSPAFTGDVTHYDWLDAYW